MWPKCRKPRDSGGHGFSHSSLSKVLLALIVLQMRPAKAINATWAAPEGTADTFLEVLDKTIMSYMKKNNPINDELPPLWSTFWFYQKAHTYCRLGFDSVLSAPFKSIGIPLEKACWKSAATPGQRRRLRKERRESIALKFWWRTVKYCWERNLQKLIWIWKCREGSDRERRAKPQSLQQASPGVAEGSEKS